MTQRLYDRTSRTISYDDVDPALRAAIEQHAEERLLGPVRPVAVVDTHSVNLKKGGLFGRLAGRSEKEHRTVALLLPQALVVVTTGAERGVVVMSTRLPDIARIGGRDPQLIVDSGVSVESRWNGHNQDIVSYYVGLGDDPAGREFQDRLRAAVVAARQ
ncbi:hypothetical protein [Dactylosporangium salmoneum]|uniref:Uncharacterized protein n=1 Tax=Dactylosporangium salmoneum TaxID=53361 RepID=A0ABP5UQD3_9ACTN